VKIWSILSPEIGLVSAATMFTAGEFELHDVIIQKQGSHSPGKPGKLLEFYVRPGIFGVKK